MARADFDARLLANDLDRIASGGSRTAPAADPSRAAAARRGELGIAASARLVAGRVVAAYAYLHAYRVQLENGGSTLFCTTLLPSTAGMVGPTSVGGYRPGDFVFCMLHPQMTYGLILGAIPAFMTDPELCRSDVIHQASRCGLRVDRVHGSIFRAPDASGAADWSGNRPFDGLPGMEAGWMAETGLRIALDPYMAQLAADEATGVFAFYHDQLLRIAGFNLQEFSAGHEREVLLDEGEIAGYHGVCVYPWEAYGATAAGQEVFRELDSDAVQLKEPHYSALEPAADRQQPFHRAFALSGYLGQGGRRTVVGPPGSPTVLAYGGGEAAQPALPGLFDERISLAGGYALQSAHEILMVKRTGIPGPRRRRRVEDPSGDNREGYRFGGLEGAGAGPEHVVRAGLEADDEDGARQRVASIADTVAYVCNFEGVHPLHYHSGDWQLPQADEGPLPGNCPPPDFARLAEDQFLQAPSPYSFQVDHRYGAVDYTPGVSVLALLQDGSIVLGESGGAEIILSGGTVRINAPGDILLASGRHVVSLAGRDFIARARNSFDVTCAEGDGRLKAEVNLHMLAGNSGTGGMLLESRGRPRFDYEGEGEDVRSGGIHLKAAAGDVDVWAGTDVYVRTGAGSEFGAGGTITLDAGRGRGRVVEHAATADRYLAFGASDFFGPEDSPNGANRFSPGVNVLGGPTLIGGRGVVLGGMVVERDVAIVGGHVHTEQAFQHGGSVGALDAGALGWARDITDQGRTVSDAVMDDAREAVSLKPAYEVGGPGSDEVIERVTFSCRNAAQYRTDGARIWEARWQQIARLTRGLPAVWVEPPVVAGSAEGMPYPGVSVWRDRAGLVEQDLSIYDEATGRPKRRDDEAYTEPKLRESREVVADGNYGVIP